jgi:hypothetical protein
MPHVCTSLQHRMRVPHFSSFFASIKPRNYSSSIIVFVAYTPKCLLYAELRLFTGPIHQVFMARLERRYVLDGGFCTTSCVYLLGLVDTCMALFSCCKDFNAAVPPKGGLRLYFDSNFMYFRCPMPCTYRSDCLSNVQALNEAGTWSPNTLVSVATQQTINRVLSAWSGLVEITGGAAITVSHKMHALASFCRSRGFLRFSNVVTWLANKVVTHDVRLVLLCPYSSYKRCSGADTQ